MYVVYVYRVYVIALVEILRVLTYDNNLITTQSETVATIFVRGSIESCHRIGYNTGTDSTAANMVARF